MIVSWKREDVIERKIPDTPRPQHHNAAPQIDTVVAGKQLQLNNHQISSNHQHLLRFSPIFCPKKGAKKQPPWRWQGTSLSSWTFTPPLVVPFAPPWMSRWMHGPCRAPRPWSAGNVKNTQNDDTGDGCEVLHQLIDGKPPIIYRVSTILLVVQDFATIFWCVLIIGLNTNMIEYVWFLFGMFHMFHNRVGSDS